MVFSSLSFLCIFLPITFLLYLCTHRLGFGNALLIISSIIFYAYGEPIYVVLILLSVGMNYLFGLKVGEGDKRRPVLILAVALNLLFLFYFKYAGFAVSSVNAVLKTDLPVPQIALPLGISFYTFQALSYVVDVYRGDVAPQRNLSYVLLYISLFPQLVAGPIVKYHDIEPQIAKRDLVPEEMEMGLRRFACGLGKKVLIANTMAGVADRLFEGYATLGTAGSWVAALAYSLQIYYDFSGYSDMAIGLGHLFGFTFQENFEHPYASTSIKEFWRRWHISLSTWFKEYLYIPLGGNRKGKVRTGLNKAAVFLLCGLWHGASWTFVVWGIIHGAFSLLEEVTPLRKLPRALGHLYTMFVVVVAFVVFRADTFTQAVTIIRHMTFAWTAGSAESHILLASQLTPLFIATAFLAVLLSFPVAPALVTIVKSRMSEASYQVLCDVLAAMLIFFCIVALSSGTYNPFIYFRF